MKIDRCIYNTTLPLTPDPIIRCLSYHILSCLIISSHTSGRSMKIDRCIYNTMADTDNCTKQSLDEIKSAHFTVCQKPWNCYKAFVNGLCHRWTGILSPCVALN